MFSIFISFFEPGLKSSDNVQLLAKKVYVLDGCRAHRASVAQKTGAAGSQGKLMLHKSGTPANITCGSYCYI